MSAQQLADLGVATVYEAAGRQGLLDADYLQIVPGARAAGPARTVRCGQDDNLGVHRLLASAGADEVLVLTMPSPTPVALVGDLLALQARTRRVAGLLVDAAVRDRAELVGLGLPTWARWVRARGAAKCAHGELDVPVQVAGQWIAPGDIVVMDADGVVVVPQAQGAQVSAAACRRWRDEAHLRPRLLAGESTVNLVTGDRP